MEIRTTLPLEELTDEHLTTILDAYESTGLEMPASARRTIYARVIIEDVLKYRSLEFRPTQFTENKICFQGNYDTNMDANHLTLCLYPGPFPKPVEELRTEIVDYLQKHGIPAIQ